MRDEQLTEEQEYEVDIMVTELKAFLRQLNERSADPFIATSLVLHQFVVIARQLFGDPVAYANFIFAVTQAAVLRGNELFEDEDDEGETYVH